MDAYQADTDHARLLFIYFFMSERTRLRAGRVAYYKCLISSFSFLPTFVEDLGVASGVGGDSKPRVEPRKLADLRLHDLSQPAQRYAARLDRLPVGAVGVHHLHAWGGWARNEEQNQDMQTTFQRATEQARIL